MTSTIETGHAKNVANFEDLISFVTGFGPVYNPSKNAIKLLQLNTVHTNAGSSLQAVTDAQTPFDNAIHARAIVFETLSPLVTRIIGALEAIDATTKTIKGAQTIARKLHGTRAVPKKPKIPPKNTLDSAPATVLINTANPVNSVTSLTSTNTSKNISASQLSFDHRTTNFSKLITLLTAEPLYVPNETDLTINALTALLGSLKTTNTSVVNVTPALLNARIARNNVLYAPQTGLYDIQAAVKSYVKSIFGTKKPEYKQVSGIKFSKTR